MCQVCKKLAGEIDCDLRTVSRWYHDTGKTVGAVLYACNRAAAVLQIKRPPCNGFDTGSLQGGDKPAAAVLQDANTVDPKTGLTGVQTEACEAILASGHLTTTSHRAIRAYLLGKPVASLAMSEINRALSLCGYPQLATRE